MANIHPYDLQDHFDAFHVLLECMRTSHTLVSVDENEELISKVRNVADVWCVTYKKAGSSDETTDVCKDILDALKCFVHYNIFSNRVPTAMYYYPSNNSYDTLRVHMCISDFKYHTTTCKRAVEMCDIGKIGIGKLFMLMSKNNWCWYYIPKDLQTLFYMWMKVSRVLIYTMNNNESDRYARYMSPR